MARKYNEFISVDEDFIPVFTSHSDRDFPNKWKSFYPHDSFKSIIKQMVDTLEMSTIEKNKSLWMSGGYGTGKTYASFVVKHLLEDDISKVKSYCESNNMMDIYARINGIRSKGNILVVHRSSSASVIGDNRLFNCIIESIKSSLKANGGYKYFGSKSQYDKVLSILKDPNSAFDFSRAFYKYKTYFTEFSKPESVIKTLEEIDFEESSELLETIVNVAEQEGYVWATSTTDVINWIDDIIKGNNLYALVFIWDEFTEFFKNNRNSITGLQEIAQASPSIHFYFFLITHGNSQIITDLNARKVIEARFKQSNIDMADDTAFKLMNNAIKINPDLSNEWAITINDLWHKVEGLTRNKMLKMSIDGKETEFKGLFPMHPYMAYLLKIISKDISSNQRTMFQFLSGDYNDGGYIKTNFRWFIDNYSNDFGKWNFLTADYIWSYFFNSDNVDLDSVFKNIISQYVNYENICGNNEDKKRVLKVALLLTAMQQKSGASRATGQTSLLRPTLSNIVANFVGTPIESQIVNIMTEFSQKGLFSKIQEGDDVLFVPPVGNIDENKFNEIIESVKKDITFEKLICDTNNYNVYEQFKPLEYISYRYEIFAISVNNYKDAVEKANNLSPNRIPLFYIFAKDEIEQGKIKETIKNIYTNVNKNCVVVDFSGQLFSDASYDKFITSKAEEKYYSLNPNQSNHCDLARGNAEKVVDEWKKKLYVTTIDVYSDNSQYVTFQGGSNLRKKLREINSLFFGCGLEEISTNEKLFAVTGYKETVAQMGMSKIGIPSNFSYLNIISTKLANEGIWNNRNFVKQYPNHIVTKIKNKIDEVINNGFIKDNKVAITDIWCELQKPPFGFLPCTGTVFLLGFLMQEFADSTYYKYDGANTVSLTFTDLSDLLVSMVKELPKIKNQFIVKQTPEHLEFCSITGDIFKIAKQKQTSIDDIAKNINLFLKSNEYPLWCLVQFVENELEDSPIFDEEIRAINLLCEFISGEKKAGRDSTRIADELYKLYKTTPMLSNELGKIVSSDNMRQGMDYYIASYKPGLIQLAQKLNVQPNIYLGYLVKKLSADASYLWDKGDIEHQIDNLYADYYYIDNVNKILQEKKASFDEIKKGVKDKFNIIRMPLAFAIEYNPMLSDIFTELMKLMSNSTTDWLKSGSIIEKNADKFNSFFNNQIDTFNAIIKEKVLQDVAEDELEYAFQNISSGVFFRTSDEFVIESTSLIKKYRQNKKVNQVKDYWIRKTNCTNAIELSTKLEFPILIAFNDNKIAKEVFDIVNGVQLFNEATIDSCIEFVKGHSLDVLFNGETREKLFREYFLGEYSYLIKDINVFKNELFNYLNCPIYEWSAKLIKINLFVKEYAEKIYKTQSVHEVKAKIQTMDQKAIAEYLMKLIEDKPLVGIEILKDNN